MDENIVQNIIKYCPTSKITVVFIDTCNKVKSRPILYSASLIVAGAQPPL